MIGVLFLLQCDAVWSGYAIFPNLVLKLLAIFYMTLQMCSFSFIKRNKYKQKYKRHV